MTAGNAILIVAIVTGLSLIGALFFVMFKIRQISREFFGTSSLIEGLKRQEALEDDTPKSVSGMTRVELPRIEKDFPEFHWPEWKQRCENQLKGYLEALEHRDLSYLGKVSVSLKDQVRLKIEEMEEKEIREEFDGGNYRELAAKYGLTERWVRFILFGKLDNLDDDMEGQMSIYDYPEAF